MMWPFNRKQPVETPEQRLERIVRETRDSYECRRFRERREAALKGLGRA